MADAAKNERNIRRIVGALKGVEQALSGLTEGFEALTVEAEERAKADIQRYELFCDRVALDQQLLRQEIQDHKHQAGTHDDDAE